MGLLMQVIFDLKKMKGMKDQTVYYMGAGVSSQKDVSAKALERS